jgi:hypothetical protein
MNNELPETVFWKKEKVVRRQPAAVGCCKLFPVVGHKSFSVGFG